MFHSEFLDTYYRGTVSTSKDVRDDRGNVEVRDSSSLSLSEGSSIREDGEVPMDEPRRMNNEARPTSPTGFRMPAELLSVGDTTVRITNLHSAESAKTAATASPPLGLAEMPSHTTVESEEQTPQPSTMTNVAAVNSYIDQFIVLKEKRQKEKEKITSLVAQLEQEFESAQDTNLSLEKQVQRLKVRLVQQQYSIVKMRQQYDNAMADQEMSFKSQYKLMVQDANAKFAQLDSICLRQQKHIEAMEKRIREEEERTKATSCNWSVCSSVAFEDLPQGGDDNKSKKSDTFFCDQWWYKLFTPKKDNSKQ